MSMDNSTWCDEVDEDEDLLYSFHLFSNKSICWTWRILKSFITRKWSDSNLSKPKDDVDDDLFINNASLKKNLVLRWIFFSFYLDYKEIIRSLFDDIQLRLLIDKFMKQWIH
jgi:hypothetical protein